LKLVDISTLLRAFKSGDVIDINVFTEVKLLIKGIVFDPDHALKLKTCRRVLTGLVRKV